MLCWCWFIGELMKTQLLIDVFRSLVRSSFFRICLHVFALICVDHTISIWRIISGRLEHLVGWQNGLEWNEVISIWNSLLLLIEKMEFFIQKTPINSCLNCLANTQSITNNKLFRSSNFQFHYFISDPPKPCVRDWCEFDAMKLIWYCDLFIHFFFSHRNYSNSHQGKCNLRLNELQGAISESILGFSCSQVYCMLRDLIAAIISLNEIRSVFVRLAELFI